MPQIIETTSNHVYRVVGEFGDQHYDCVEVKKSRGGWVDKAKARVQLINKSFIWKVLA